MRCVSKEHQYLSKLQTHIKSRLPTSPHCEFENQKVYKTIRHQIDMLYDAEVDVQIASRNIDVGMTPIGMNYHFYIYMAERYGKMFKALKTFESALKKSPDPLKKYYDKLSLPQSSEVYTIFKQFLIDVEKQVVDNLEKAKMDHPSWEVWDNANLVWDDINKTYKDFSK